MRRLTRLLAGAAVIATTAALLGSCVSDDDPAAGSPVLPARTVEADEVTVEITPAQLDADGAVFDIAFDTHSVDLSVDVAAAATLVVDGTEWDGAEWDGAGAGGHHREGRLRFRPGGDPTGSVELTIAGLPDPVRATWDLDGE